MNYGNVTEGKHGVHSRLSLPLVLPLREVGDDLETWPLLVELVLLVDLLAPHWGQLTPTPASILKDYCHPVEVD